MYAMATRWTFKVGSGEEVFGVNQDEIMPALDEQPGYVRSVVVRTGTDSFLSLVCWETEDDAKRAAAVLTPLLIRHLGHLVRGVERVGGTVAYERWARSPEGVRTD
ncbi:MAG TPA: hypothetical protein VMD28_01045 [Acidimicrobiales bacterium]|jgi:hypothetical protein|nr:hypothetical protein [Acidimicrobiales bacterium]